MSKFGRLGLPGLLLAIALVLASCAGSDVGSQQEEQGSQSGGMQEMDMGSGDEAPEMLVQDGEYSDERFIDMMVPHHTMAVEQARVAQENAEHPEIEQLAGEIISSQQQEIEELQSIKEEEFGASETPTMMNPQEMDNMGMTMPDELENQQPFDKAFIDSMMPHHSSAIEMASVALKRSDNPDIQRIARGIVDAQAEEIGQMIQWRQEWYPEG
jgi:uncharacterized protein (DUF305 family)